MNHVFIHRPDRLRLLCQVRVPAERLGPRLGESVLFGFELLAGARRRLTAAQGRMLAAILDIPETDDLFTPEPPAAPASAASSHRLEGPSWATADHHARPAFDPGVIDAGRLTPDAIETIFIDLEAEIGTSLHRAAMRLERALRGAPSPKPPFAQES